MENKDVILVGFDIHNLVKEILEKFSSSDKPGASAREKAAYQLGAESVLGLLSQILNEMIVNENSHENAEYIAVHVPGLAVMEEFSTIEEILVKQAYRSKRGLRRELKILEQHKMRI